MAHTLLNLPAFERLLTLFTHQSSPEAAQTPQCCWEGPPKNRLSSNSGLTLPIRRSTSSADFWAVCFLTRFHTRSRSVACFLRPLLEPRSYEPFFQKLHLNLLGRGERSLNTLEKVLETRTFLVGERLTLADLSVAPVVLHAAKYYIDKENASKFPSVVRYVETILNQPQIAQFWTIQWEEKIVTYIPPARDTKKKEEKPKATPPAKPKKEEKKKEPEPEDEDDDLVPKEEPKAKHPLESLPKSTFNLEDWKRAYSNKETKGPGGAIEWFYQK